MEDGEKLSLEQIRAFVESSSEVRFKGKDREEVYGWMTRVLRQHGYVREGREVKGLVRRYVRRMTGLSRAQVTRLVAQFGKDREEVYGWMTRVLRQHGYVREGREVKGLVRRYVRRMTGLSRAQV